MLNEGSLVASLAAFHEAAAIANSAPADRKAALLAWALRSRSTPLALMGRWHEAEDTIAAAMDVTGGMEEPATQVETLLLKARVLMGTNRAGLAMELLDDAGRLVVAAPPWTHGWLPRHRADALLCMALGALAPGSTCVRLQSWGQPGVLALSALFERPARPPREPSGLDETAARPGLLGGHVRRRVGSCAKRRVP